MPAVVDNASSSWFRVKVSNKIKHLNQLAVALKVFLYADYSQVFWINKRDCIRLSFPKKSFRYITIGSDKYNGNAGNTGSNC